MVSEVTMRRELFNMSISQKSKSEFFSATDLIKAGNKWRMANSLPGFDFSQYLQRQSTKEYIIELEKKYGIVKISARGRGQHTWVHPLLFIDIALSISPTLKIEVYEWLFDKLIKFRNDSGDSYKEMCGALYTRSSNLREFPNKITDIAREIKSAIGVKDWESASQEQLELRDKIHRSIKLLCRVLTDINQIVRIGIEEHIKK